MARAPRLEEVLAALRQARQDPTSEASLREIRKALAGRSPHAVAKAAAIAGEADLAVLMPELLAAFDRFMEDPGSDKGCTAKTAVADALYRMGHDDPGVFLRGIRHVQKEGAYGEPVDTAVDLRGSCALGLVRMGYRDSLVELADLLADPEPRARIAAVRAVAYRGGEDGAPLLRLKALAGDREPEVTAECLAALLKIAPAKSISFAATFLDSPEEAVAEGAALALGASRLPDAFERLREWTERTLNPGLRRAGLLALATLRREDAFEYLLDLVRQGPVGAACDAIAALGIYKDDEALRSRMVDAAGARAERPIREAMDREIG